MRRGSGGIPPFAVAGDGTPTARSARSGSPDRKTRAVRHNVHSTLQSTRPGPRARARSSRRLAGQGLARTPANWSRGNGPCIWDERGTSCFQPALGGLHCQAGVGFMHQRSVEQRRARHVLGRTLEGGSIHQRTVEQRRLTDLLVRASCLFRVRQRGARAGVREQRRRSRESTNRSQPAVRA